MFLNVQLYTSFQLLYQAIDGKPHHTGIEMHYDGCDITWQAMLTRNDEYEGGGTYFRCLRKTVVLKQGQVLVHPGKSFDCKHNFLDYDMNHLIL